MHMTLTLAQMMLQRIRIRKRSHRNFPVLTAILTRSSDDVA